MSDSGTQPSATDSPLGRTLNGGDISGALAASQQNQDFLKKAALALPTALKASRDDEAAKSRPILDKINDLTEAEIAQIKGPPPQPQATNVAEQWGSPAMLLAVIGSAFTRQPLTNALNAGAAVMKGFQQRDYDAAQTAFKNWKEANDTSLKLMSIQRESYADALKAIEHSGGEDRKDAMATFTALAHAFNDQPMIAAAAAGRWDHALAIDADRGSLAEKAKIGAELAKKQADLQFAAFNAVTKLQATPPDSPDYAKAKADAESAATALKNWHDTQIGKGAARASKNIEIVDPSGARQWTGAAHQSSDGTGWINDATGQKIDIPEGGRILIAGAQAASDPATVDFVAKGIARYDMAPLTGWVLRGDFGQRVMAKVLKDNPEYDQTKYQAKIRGEVAFTSGRQADTVRSMSVSIDHLAVMDQAADALANNDVQALNKVRNRVEQELGYEGPVDFNFVKSIVGAEVNKAIIGGVGSLTDREELRNAFDISNSPQQLAGVAQFAKRLMAGQLAGFERQAGTTGMSKSDFDKALSPRAKEELHNLQVQQQPHPDWAKGMSASPSGEVIYTDGKEWFNADHTPHKAP